jgi:integrase
VRKALEPIWEKTPETGRRLRARLETVFEFAGAAKYRDPGVPNPARLEVMKYLLGGEKRRVEHHAAMAYAELPKFVAELRSQQSTMAEALEFTILTAARTGEVFGAPWSEIDLKSSAWTIPAERMKSRRSHRVPLSKRAVEILAALPRRGDLVFGRADGAARGSRGMLDTLRDMRPGTTVHGFRSSFRDWAAERTAFPNHVIEMALAHAIPNAVEAAYRRGDLFEKRRRLMDDWARFLAKPVSLADSKNVLALKR